MSDNAFKIRRLKIVKIIELLIDNFQVVIKMILILYAIKKLKFLTQASNSRAGFLHILNT